MSKNYNVGALSELGCGQCDPASQNCCVLQLVQDTLLDEGLRVVKEMVASQNKESSNNSYDDNFNSDNKVQVISSSGGNIIAVANPALSMLPSEAASGVDKAPATPLVLLKQEPLSPAVSPTPAKSE
ncbi:hypothetical protein L9F63_024690 [Diploptera punctata]|uniref:Uncharacterized protein n=1 Tax=Diploptera punctata TaxID=6984 RepID=A0AAD7ZFX5_DIPPU|nr:hypothetical protein L9F63_024690 [Diploptera punctata]